MKRSLWTRGLFHHAMYHADSGVVDVRIQPKAFPYVFHFPKTMLPPRLP